MGITIVTFIVVFLVQNSQNRDTASIHIKLDELISAIDGAREELTGIEHLTSHEIDANRLRLEEAVNGNSRKQRVQKNVKAMLTH